MNERLLKPNEISCRIQTISEKGLSLLLYVTSRAGQTMLDEKYGELGWKDSYKIVGGELYCTISVWDKEKEQWISKEDIGTASNAEKEKGRASDAFKRACVKFGIARELYSAPFIWIPASACKIQDRNGKFMTYDKFKVHTITYNAAREIDSLKISNQNLDIVFAKVESGKINRNHYNALLELIKRAKVDTEQILEQCNINDLQEMDMQYYVPICNKLQIIIEKREKDVRSGEAATV